ncbi:MAG: hypothetical protein WC683_05085 [bacterium]
MAKHPGGRPTKLTPAIQKSITDMISLGNYIETASALAGISKNTLYDWLRRGAREKQRLHDNPRARMKKKEAPFVEFSDSVERALAESESVDIGYIATAAKTQWQAAAWRLERRFPDRWGRKDHSKIEMTGKDGQPLERIVIYLPDNGRDTPRN